jgi:hypothetical protein
MQGKGEPTDKTIAGAMLYATASGLDGTLTLTVFNGGSVNLPVPFVESLIRDLEQHLERHGHRKGNPYEN